MPALRRLALFAFAIVLSSVSTARSAPMDECTKVLGRGAIAPCTLVIDDQKETRANHWLAYLYRARAELDVSELEKAEADIEAGLGLQPNSTFGYRLRARLRGLQGRNTEARADFTKALQLSEAPGAKYVAYTERGQFLSRIKEYADALADFDAAIHLDGSKAQAYVGRAVVYKGMGKIDEALASLEWAATVEPTYWVTYVERGDILLAQKRFDEAVAAYDLALAQRPAEVRAQRGRTAAIAAGGKPGEPVKVATPAPPPAPAPSPAPSPAPAPAPSPATVPPDAPPPAPAAPRPPATQSADAPDPAGQDAEVRRKKLQGALALRQNRKLDEALAVYDAMLKAVPSDFEAAIEKGRTLMQLTRWKEAIDLFKAVIDNKEAPSNVKAVALVNQSEILVANNQFELALKTSNDALQLNPRFDAALFWRGLSEYFTGAFAAAIADFAQAESIVPKSSNYPSWEALAQIGAGDIAKAKEAIARSLAIEPDNVNALHARVRLNLAAGDIAAAEADFAQLQRRSQPIPIFLQTQQLIMLHKVLQPSDQPVK